MKKIYFLLSILFLATAGFAQTTLIPVSDGGFETGATFAANGWTVVNDATNTWNLGTLPGWFTGARGAYISNSAGATWTYTNTVNQRSHFYRDIAFPATEPVIKLDFDIRSDGENNWDNLLVYVANTTITPTNAGPAGTATTVTGWPGYTDGTTGYFLTVYNNGAVVPTTTTHITYTFTAAQAAFVAGSTKRLIFTWKNDNSVGTNPPAAVDNITLVSSCSGPTVTAATAITQNGATLNWNAVAGATGYNVQYRITGSTTWLNAAGNPYATNSAVLTGLSPATLYQFQVASLGPVCNAYSLTGTFTTLCGNPTLPWSEGFEGVSPVGSNVFPPCWTRELISGNSPGTYNLNDNFREPHTGTNLLYTQWNSTTWVYTPGFALTAGTSYTFSFWMKNKVVTSPVDFVMDVKYGTAAASASMTNTLQAGYTASNANWTQFTYVFTPATTGTFYMGIKSTSATSVPWYLSFDDFAFTQTITCPLASTAISYASTSYCTTSGPATPTVTGTTGGTFSSTPGLTIDPNTGVITPATSTPGNYVVTYTVVGAGACGTLTRTANITITTPPSGTFSYAGTPYCSTVTSATPTSSLPAGGVFSSAAGLTLNAATGVINPSTSTAGAYTVTYTLAATASCGAYSTTANVTITAMPNASFNYGTAPICTSSTTANPAFTGTAGGVFSSTTGLSINAATGVINPSTSTPGTYLVTYTVAAAGGCAQYTTTTSVTINSISVAPTSASASSPNICGTTGITDLTVTGGVLGSGAAYTWYAGACGGSSIGTGATLTGVQVFNTTTYYVRIEGICNTTSCVSVTVNVNPVPVVVLTAAANPAINPFSQSVLLATVSPVGNYIYQFKKDGVILTNNTTSPLIPLTPDSVGTYVVTVFNTVTGCSGTSNTVVISAAASNNLFITPNPNKGQFAVRYYAAPSEFGTARSISVYDSKGSRVAAKNITVTSAYNIINFDLTQHAGGSFTVYVTDAKGKRLAVQQVMVLP